MEKKVISIDELKKEKFEEELPDHFELQDILKFSNMIEYSINTLYDTALLDEKYHSVCTTEQIKILTNIYSSFFKILFNEYSEFDGSSESNRIMFQFASELYKICSELPNVEEIRKNIDKKIYKLENKESKKKED